MCGRIADVARGFVHYGAIQVEKPDYEVITADAVRINGFV